MRYKRKTNTKKYLLFLLAIALIGSGVLTYYTLSNDQQETAQPADDTFTEGTQRDVLESPERRGGVTDTSEDEAKQPLDTTTEDSGWLVSDEGDITLKEPKEDDLFTSGSRITGTANLNRVHYRLIDNHVGVVATGSISVVDGRFSGIFEFESNGTEGRLDIFSTLDSGAEVNIIEVPIRLQ